MKHFTHKLTVLLLAIACMGVAHACPTITSTTLTGKTYNSVVVNWTADDSGTWEIRYQQGSLGWSAKIEGISSNSYEFTDLVTGAPYDFQVRPSCDPEKRMGICRNVHADLCGT